MNEIYPKEFIKQVFIKEVGELIDDHPYISFMVMGAGLEFLGKAIDSNLADWETGKSRKTFDHAVKTLNALSTYRPYLAKTSSDLYGSLRCGLLHGAKPKKKITLSSKNEKGHLTTGQNNLNLRCEEFYAHFKAACEEVISMNFPSGDKMKKPYLAIPGDKMNIDTNLDTAITQSLG